MNCQIPRFDLDKIQPHSRLNILGDDNLNKKSLLYKIINGNYDSIYYLYGNYKDNIFKKDLKNIQYNIDNTYQPKNNNVIIIDSNIKLINEVSKIISTRSKQNANIIIIDNIPIESQHDYIFVSRYQKNNEVYENYKSLFKNYNTFIEIYNELTKNNNFMVISKLDNKIFWYVQNETKNKFTIEYNPISEESIESINIENYSKPLQPLETDLKSKNVKDKKKTQHFMIDKELKQPIKTTLYILSIYLTLKIALVLLKLMKIIF
jgi:hypothetical protein